MGYTYQSFQIGARLDGHNDARTTSDRQAWGEFRESVERLAREYEQRLSSGFINVG